MHRFTARMAQHIEPGLIVESGCIHYQRVALPFAGGVAAPGRTGAASGVKSARLMMAYFEIVSSSIPGTLVASAALVKSSPKRRFISATPVGCTCQSPERSGFPLEARGAGAVRFGLPSRVRGVPGAG